MSMTTPTPHAEAVLVSEGLGRVWDGKRRSWCG